MLQSGCCASKYQSLIFHVATGPLSLTLPRYAPRVGELIHLIVGEQTCSPALITKIHKQATVNLVTFLDMEDFTERQLDSLTSPNLPMNSLRVPYRIPKRDKGAPGSWHYVTECPF